MPLPLVWWAASRVETGEESQRPGVRGAIEPYVMEPEFQRVVESLPGAVLITDVSGTVLYVNQAAAELLGVPPADLAGGSAFALAPDHLRETYRHGFDAWVEAGGARRGPLRATVRAAGGHEIEVDVSVSTHRSASDELQVVALIDAVRPRADTEQRLEDLHRDVLSSISHDLKNPLSTISGQAQITQRRALDLDSDEGRKIARSVASIEVAAKRMNRMIDDLVDVARLRAGTPLQLRMKPIDLVRLVQGMAEEYCQAAVGRQVEVESDGPGLPVEADGLRLERALLYLVSTLAGRGAEESRVDLWVGAENGEAVVRIRGAAQPARFDSTEQVGPLGDGIGLAGVRQIVEGHRGHIELQGSAATTVVVRLPMQS